MHALIVVAHHDPDSLTHRVAATIAEHVSSYESQHTCEIADLAKEGFDPRFTASDRDTYHRVAPVAPDIVAQQQRIDNADALVLVFPVYWWSMPALLKGWIDRVFCNGWAFDFGVENPESSKLRDLRVHLVALGASGAEAYARHGYDQAMNTQIEHGIFGYCGAQIVSSRLLGESESGTAGAHLLTAAEIGRSLFEPSQPSL
ncbi:NAD(P)H-dependent oxidoreductase [Pseudomonas sp. CC120222-01a]|uniref:NAD(P)H-dependent oxidoreductase n=1 Tax=Pseudomonas sp. CC120222-01a TaxID=1378075 RepID=UPI000D8C80F5|nr:NAD(P)H-dependent oxidoreductase [Pseudomonas sp. CC120222-01a]PVZ41219.1 NAD(P)H dehydrogenase (quinone) [Pseudomonas sp. CC120222-01a]